jgi:hypothetical protein
LAKVEGGSKCEGGHDGEDRGEGEGRSEVCSKGEGEVEYKVSWCKVGENEEEHDEDGEGDDELMGGSVGDEVEDEEVDDQECEGNGPSTIGEDEGAGEGGSEVCNKGEGEVEHKVSWCKVKEDEEEHDDVGDGEDELVEGSVGDEEEIEEVDAEDCEGDGSSISVKDGVTERVRSLQAPN